MADWTANSGFGATRDRGTVRRAEPVLRPTREGTEGPRAERFTATRDQEEPKPAAEARPRMAAGAAAMAQYNAVLEGSLAKARLAVWAGGGALSLLLIAGVGIWGYKLVLREVMGLPVVAAEEGPMRIVPADPGGEVVPQQGFAVNAIPGAGTAAPPSDVLRLAPQTAGLAEEDMQVVQTDAEEGEVMPLATGGISADPLGIVGGGTASPNVAAADATTAAPAQPAAPVVDSTVATLAAAASTAIDPTAPPEVQAQQAARLVASMLPAGRALTAEEILALANQVAAGAQPVAPAAGTTAPATEAAKEISAPAEAAPAAGEATPGALALAAPADAKVASLAAPATETTTLAPAAPAAPVEVAAEPALATAPAAIEVIAATVPGPSAAPLPRARPAALPVASAAPAATAAVVATTASAEEPAPAPEPAPASVPAGTHMIQLGAFDSSEIAGSEWTRLQAAFPEFLGSREHVVQEVQSGGATLYRLRALGFPERADARILCTALTAEGTDCIPVTVD